MHESLIDNLHGYVDACIQVQNPQTEETDYKLVGWCGSEELDISSIRLRTNQVNGEPVFSEWSEVSSQIPRMDVADFYQTDKFLNTGFEITFNPTASMTDATLQVLGSDGWVDFLKVPDNLEVTTTQTKPSVEIPPVENISQDLFEFEIKRDATPSFLVVDNFYTDPDMVREFALRQTFNKHADYHKGARTEERFIADGTRVEFEKLLNKKIVNWDAHGTNGIFQYCTAEDALVYHMDSQTYAATIYLTPDAPPECGTSFFRSKVNKLNKPPTEQDVEKHGKSEDELMKEIFSTGFYDKTNLELIDIVGNVYNRLVMWDAKMIHAASEYFGNDKANSRLFHLFFFDTK